MYTVTNRTSVKIAWSYPEELLKKVEPTIIRIKTSTEGQCPHSHRGSALTVIEAISHSHGGSALSHRDNVLTIIGAVLV